MLFKETWQQVLDGTKTQTRRPVKPGETTFFDAAGIAAIYSASGRVKWVRGFSYAVQPGRGKPAIWLPPEGAPIDDPLAEYIRKTESVRATWGPKVKAWLRAKGYQEARIRITKIRRERLFEIKPTDCIKEGIVAHLVLFDHEYYREGSEFAFSTPRSAFRHLWNSLYRKPYRWEDNPEVWVLEFELVKEEEDG